ncbi:MAG TPA: arylsulfotransferase family protein, partial [Solirubrobacteraceae bacterium]|nr:arylsulfotransferase family protein [Solirubrobacteraceae bacterium]
ILSPRGQLLWFDPLGPNTSAFNLEVQRYRGRPVLTWWQSGDGQGGQDVIMNASYRPVARLGTAWGFWPDLHEFQVTPQGTALRDANFSIRANLTSIGGPADGALIDYVIQEVDIRTGQVLWEWHSLGHVPLSASYWPLDRTPFDAFHLNSIQQLPRHRLLISLRSTWSVYEIDERTGRVLWTLGGKRSTFGMGPGTKFQWQHDAHLNPHGLLTLFDDAWAAVLPPTEAQSSAKELKIDTANRTVSLVRSFRHTPPLLAGAEGSAQLLPNHDLFVGWGTEPVFSQYSPDGRQIFNASLPLGDGTYRAYRFAWTGHPLTRPALSVSRVKRAVWLYASWNGDTQVASWRVLAGSTSQNLKSVAVTGWTGFETSIRVPGRWSYFAVAALNARGQTLARSAAKTAG